MGNLYQDFYDYVKARQSGLVDQFLYQRGKQEELAPEPPTPVVPGVEELPLRPEIEPNHYTLVVTSCDRHDLLKETLRSFFDTCEVQPRYTIVVEDSDAAPTWLHDDIFRSFRIQWLSNGRRIGQIYSIDRAYSQVHTEFIFHSEDDWSFIKGNYIQPSRTILKQYPEIWTVSLRGDECNGHPLVTDPRFPFQIHEPYWRGGFGGIHFNPGLRRLSDYRRLGSYGLHVGYDKIGLTHEVELSKKHLDAGYRIGVLP